MTQRPMKPTRQPVLTHEITLSCVDPWGTPAEVETTLGYRTDDPYAVSLLFRSAGGDVEWVVSRTLLLQGLAAPVGEGDVKVYPTVGGDGSPVAILDFSSPDGRLVAEADSSEIQEFLSRTFSLVPVGTEGRHLDLDALIAALLASPEG